MQIEFIKNFNFGEIGTWPNEKYVFSPLNEKIEPISNPIYLYFSVFGNPSTDYGVYSKNNLIDYDYEHVYKDYNSDKNRYSLNLFTDTTPLSFYYIPTHRELYPYSIFNVFGIESNSTIKGFYLHPKRLFFKPIFTEKTTEGWRIQLLTRIIGQDPIFFESNNFIGDSLTIYKKDREDYSLKQEFDLPLNLLLKYELKGTEKFLNKPIINFTNLYNPSLYETYLENSDTKIKKNSIYITNKHYLKNTDTIIGENLYYNNEDNDFFNFNNHQYNFNNIDDVQNYEMFNNPLDINDKWLNIQLSAYNTYFKYYCNTEKLTGVPETSLTIKYISDCDKIKHLNENIDDTIFLFEDNGQIKYINDEFWSDNSGNIVLDLKYPPHYYNFNLKYKAFSDFYNLCSTLTFTESSYELIMLKIRSYFIDPFFIDDRYSKFAEFYHPIDDPFYKSTGILLSSLSSYYEYNLSNIIELSSFDIDVLTNSILELSSIYTDFAYEYLFFEQDTSKIKTKGIELSGNAEFSDYKYLTSTSFEGLTSIIYDLGFDNLSSSVYDYLPSNDLKIKNNIYMTSGIYNISVNYYNDTFVQEISTYETISFFINKINTLTATNIPTLTGIIYDLGEPYSNYAEITTSIYHENEYISTGISLSGDWICIDQKTAIGNNYYELTASANSFGGVYSFYAEVTSPINFIPNFKSTGAYLDGSTYKNILSSYVFQTVSPEMYFCKISTFDIKQNALYYISISSYDENITDLVVLYNTISVYTIDTKLYDNFVEGYSLNYDLTSKIIDFNTEYVKLSTYLFSDYHLSTLDLETYGVLDLIKYEFLNLSDSLKPYISCYYSEEKIPYNIYELNWIPATSGCILYVEYPNNPFGEVSFELVPKLSTYSGFIESYFKTDIKLAENYTNDTLEYNKIYIKPKNESSDNIEIEIFSISNDLENTNISWNIEPELDNISLYIKNPITEEITYISKKETLNYIKNYTSTVFISGYFNNQIKIIGYSEKYDRYAETYTNLELFNPLESGNVVIKPIIELDNRKQIRTIDVAVYATNSNYSVNIPDNFSIYWTWQYGDLIDSIYQPITALNKKFQIYSCGETDNIQNLSALSLFIRPNTNYGSIENNVKLKAYIFNEKNNFYAEYNFIVDDYPIKNLYDLNIETYYDLYQSEIIHNTINSDLFTRPLNDFSVYTFKIDKSETSIFKFLSSYENITWEFYDDFGFYQIITGTEQFDHYEIYNSLNWNLNYIKLTIENVQLPAWNYPHTFSKILKINSLAESEFYNPLKLLIYPEYYWTPETPYIIFTNNENFIYSLEPSTYENKKSETYNFYVSANKEAKFYEYSTGDILTTPTGMLELRESSEFKSIYGLSISVTAYDDTYFPKENGVNYKIATDNGLIDAYLDNLVFTTIPFNSDAADVLDNFSKSPKLIPFDTFNFAFSSIISAVDIKNDRIITIDQYIVPNYKQSPVKIVNEISTVTYTLSTAYWVAYKKIEAKTGRYNIFELNIGNPVEPLTISDKRVQNLYLYAEADIEKTISYETFKNYPSYENKELWKTVNEKIEPKILDDYYTLQNTDIE